MSECGQEVGANRVIIKREENRDHSEKRQKLSREESIKQEGE